MFPPKFGLLEDISVTNCHIQLEEALNKLRWNRLYGNAANSKKNFFDEETRTMDINSTRVTSLPFNPGVTMPGPLKENEELDIHKFKREVLGAVGKMERKGREWGNLSEEEKVGMESLRKKVRE